MTYLPEDFEGYSNATQLQLAEIANRIQNLTEASQNVEFIFSCIAVLINIFHLTILTRKSMRNNCINMIMIGIASGDLFHTSNNVYGKILEFMKANKCWSLSNYTIIFIDAWLDFIDDFLRRQSAYLGILMAAIRVLVIKYTLNPRIQNFTNPLFVFKYIMAILTTSILISSIYYSHYTMFHIDDWSPLPQCTGFPGNYTEKVYTIILQDSFISDPFINDRNFMTMDGIIKIIPAGVLPVLTVLLVIEYRKAKINRQKVAGKEDSKPDHTTKMVTLMTISSMIAEGSVGISYILRGVAGEQWGFVRISLNLIQICYVFVAINASMHCIICLVVSTPYRNVVKELRFLKKKKNVVISDNKPAKGSVSSVASVSQVVM